VDNLGEIPDGHSVGSDSESLLAFYTNLDFTVVIVSLMAMPSFLSVPVTFMLLGSVVMPFMGMVVTLTSLGAVVMFMTFM